MKYNSSIKIESIKHDHSLHRLWEENTILYVDDAIIIGSNNRTKVIEGSGNMRITDTPALFYFDRRTWFNIIYLCKEDRPFYYCNISSPITFRQDKIQYIDYDIDFIVQSDYTYNIVDMDEYRENIQRYDYPESVQLQVSLAKRLLQKWIRARKDPFNCDFLGYWLSKMDAKN